MTAQKTTSAGLPSTWLLQIGIILWCIVSIAILGFGGFSAAVWGPLALVAFGAAAIVAVAASLQRRTLPWHPIMLPAVGFGALVAWQWSTSRSADPGATHTQLLQLCAGGAVLFLSLLAMRSRSNLRRTGFWAWGMTGALAIEAICQYFWSDGKIYGFRDASYGTPMGPFVYHNHFAACLLLLLPLSIVVAFRGRHGAQVPWSAWMRRGMVPFLALAAMVLARSRGGVLALLAEGVLAALLWWRPTFRTLFGPAFLFACALLAALALVTNWHPLTRRFASLAQHDVSAAERLAIGNSCIAIFRSHPWLGTGFGSFAAVYPLYQSFDSGLTVEYAHDEYAQALSETGLVGAALALWFLATALSSCARSQPGLGTLERSIQRAAAVGLAGFLLHCAVDFDFHAPGLMLLFFLLCGVALSRPPIRGTPDPARAAQRGGR